MLSKNVNNKKCAPKLIFFNEKKLRKIWIIFDIENWHCNKRKLFFLVAYRKKCWWLKINSLGTIHKKSVQPFSVILTPSSPILAVHQMAMFDQFMTNFDLFFDLFFGKFLTNFWPPLFSMLTTILNFPLKWKHKRILAIWLLCYNLAQVLNVTSYR